MGPELHFRKVSGCSEEKGLAGGTIGKQEEHRKSCQCSRKKMTRIYVRMVAAGKEVERLMTTWCVGNGREGVEEYLWETDSYIDYRNF